jgi:hypothetical protein
VISIFFINFLDELGLFIEEKPILTKKKSVALLTAGCPNEFCPPAFLKMLSS